MFAYPFAHLKLRGFSGKIEYAQFLHDGSEVLFSDGCINHFSAQNEKTDSEITVLYLPDVKPHCLVPVIEIFLK